MKTNSLRFLLPFIFTVLLTQFLACNKSEKKDEILIAQKHHENIILQELVYYYMPKQISGEIFNQTDYVLTRLVFRFELYEYDPNSRLKKLFDKTSMTYDLGQFNDFVQKMKLPEYQMKFYNGVANKLGIGSLSDLQKIVDNFQQSPKRRLLARKIDLEVKIEPKFSDNFVQTINSNYSLSNVIYDFQVAKVYGRNPD